VHRAGHALALPWCAGCLRFTVQTIEDADTRFWSRELGGGIGFRVLDPTEEKALCAKVVHHVLAPLFEFEVEVSNAQRVLGLHFAHKILQLGKGRLITEVCASYRVLAGRRLPGAFLELLREVTLPQWLHVSDQATHALWQGYWSHALRSLHACIAAGLLNSPAGGNPAACTGCCGVSDQAAI
jgi:hypothetical protein